MKFCTKRNSKLALLSLTELVFTLSYQCAILVPRYFNGYGLSHKSAFSVVIGNLLVHFCSISWNCIGTQVIIQMFLILRYLLNFY